MKHKVKKAEKEMKHMDKAQDEKLVKKMISEHHKKMAEHHHALAKLHKRK